MAFKPPSPPYVGPPSRSSGSNNKPIRRIVIHCTVSPCEPGGARNIAAYFRGSSAGGSAHYVVDPGEVVQSAYDSVVAWHAPPNGNSLGVELCCTLGNQGKGHWERDNHQRMLRKAARLVAGLCLAYDVPIRKIGPSRLRGGAQGITGHIDVSRAFGQSSHWDPGPHFPWRLFIRMVRREAERIRRGGDPTPKPDPQPTPEPTPQAEHLTLQERAAGKGPGRVDRARALIRIASNRTSSDTRRRTLREWLRGGPQR